MDLRTDGKFRLIGLSNGSLEQLQAEEELTPIASVQNRFNLLAMTRWWIVTASRTSPIYLIARSQLHRLSAKRSWR
jgi:aryl-alcohol dehydrogenase-like predicted oxidoreductase